ncbi:uncharacterized protein AAES06_021414 [Glossophaga mutica]
MSHLSPPRTRPQVDPRPGQLKNWMEEAEEPPRTSALDQALLPDGRLASPDWPGTSFLVWAEATPGILRGTGPRTQRQPPAPEEPLHSPGHALHTPPEGQAGPKDSGPGLPPARRGVPSSASPAVATHPLTDGLH